MPRRLPRIPRPLAVLPWAVLLALVLTLLAAGAASARPNVVLIETDDQTLADLGNMTNTRQLIGKEGVTFDQNIVSLSQCCPSRATVLTGQYAFNHRVLTTQLPFGGFPAFEDAESLPVWLQSAGYQTGIVGKYLNQYGRDNPRYVPPGWNEWNVLTGPTVYRFFRYTINENGRLRYYPTAYQTDTLTRLSEKVIRRFSEARKPFFLWTTYVAPHEGVPNSFGDVRGRKTTVPPPLLPAGFLAAALPKPLGFNEKDVSDKPAYVRKLKRFRRGKFIQIQRGYRQRQAALAWVDRGVKDLVDTLRTAGVLNNTVIMFTSDNGFMEGQHRIVSGKIVPYEPSIRVPLLIRGPGIPRDQSREQLVANIDLGPTVAQIAGAKATWPFDGRSLLPFIRGKRDPRRAIVLDGVPVSKTDPAPTFKGLRTERYKYVVYHTGEEELYDLQTDPGELDNIARSAPGLRDRLNRRLRKLQSCRGQACRG